MTATHVRVWARPSSCDATSSSAVLPSTEGANRISCPCRPESRFEPAASQKIVRCSNRTARYANANTTGPLRPPSGLSTKASGTDRAITNMAAMPANIVTRPSPSSARTTLPSQA